MPACLIFNTPKVLHASPHIRFITSYLQSYLHVQPVIYFSRCIAFSSLQQLTHHSTQTPLIFLLAPQLWQPQSGEHLCIPFKIIYKKHIVLPSQSSFSSCIWSWHSKMYTYYTTIRCGFWWMLHKGVFVTSVILLDCCLDPRIPCYWFLVILATQVAFSPVVTYYELKQQDARKGEIYDNQTSK